MWWYLGYYTDLQAWFGPSGLLTHEMTQEMRNTETGPRFAISVLDYVNTASQLWFVYGLGLAALVMMLIGLLTRFATIASLVFVLSFVHRASILARPVDAILVISMFYLCIGPAGANFSIDAALRQRRLRRETPYWTKSNLRLSFQAATVAIRLFQVHLALIYAAMAAAQLREDTWWQGTAVWWLMARPDSRLVDLTFLNGLGGAFEYLVNFCTHAIVLYEICFALLIWIPGSADAVGAGRVRLAGHCLDQWAGELCRHDAGSESGVSIAGDAAEVLCPLVCGEIARNAAWPHSRLREAATSADSPRAKIKPSLLYTAQLLKLRQLLVVRIERDSSREIMPLRGAVVQSLKVRQTFLRASFPVAERVGRQFRIRQHHPPQADDIDPAGPDHRLGDVRHVVLQIRVAGAHHRHLGHRLLCTAAPHESAAPRPPADLPAADSRRWAEKSPAAECADCSTDCRTTCSPPPRPPLAAVADQFESARSDRYSSGSFASTPKSKFDTATDADTPSARQFRDWF